MVTVFLTSLIFQAGCKKDTAPQSDVPKVPTVTTSSVTGITATAAYSGGNVTVKGNSDVKARGVCWSTSQNPDISNTHTIDGLGTGGFVSNITNLSPNTLYYVRAYATNNDGTGYGSAFTFTTTQLSCESPITYDGKNYQTILINTQCWFQQNLNVGTRIDGNVNQTDNGFVEKHCYNDEETNCTFYGALYQWNEMMQYVTTQGTQGICPTGWHIPTDAEWAVLENYLGGDSVAGGKMKQAGLTNWAPPNTGATNSSGFTAFGAGNHTSSGYDGIMLFAYFWSSTQDFGDPDYAWSRSPYSTGKDVYRGPGNKGNSFSVRCLKN